MKGIIYRSMFSYKSVAKRSAHYSTDLIVFDKTYSKNLSLEEFGLLIQELTTDNLSFTSDKCSTIPAIALEQGKTNCKGYSAVFNAIANQLIKENGLGDKFKTEHHVGKIHFFNWDVHEWFDDPFYKDHDFNSITDLETGETLYFDPSMNDYLGVDSVKLRKKD